MPSKKFGIVFVDNVLNELNKPRRPTKAYLKAAETASKLKQIKESRLKKGIVRVPHSLLRQIETIIPGIFIDQRL